MAPQFALKCGTEQLFYVYSGEAASKFHDLFHTSFHQGKSCREYRRSLSRDFGVSRLQGDRYYRLRDKILEMDPTAEHVSTDSAVGVGNTGHEF